MGSVYLAEDLTLERQVALKILNKELINDAQFTGRFIQEARLQASLFHPNIVTLHTFFEEDNNFCMVMEYVNGMTLKDLIRKTGPIPEERTKKIFRQILEAASYAHKKGIIHRDLKPSNILIDENDFVKVLDFGIAKLLGSERFLTKIGSAAGTVYYMSPEQIRSDKHIDNRTDIYSLGITLFEMLTGRIPFNDSTGSEFLIMKEIVDTDIPDPRSIYPCISDKMVSVLYKMVSKDKKNRYNSCVEIINDIDILDKEIKKQGMETVSELKPQNVTKGPVPVQIPNKINDKKDGKRNPLVKVLITLCIIAILLSVYFVLFNTGPKEKIETSIAKGSYADAEQLIGDNQAQLGSSLAQDYRNLIEGFTLLDEGKYLNANSLINGFNASLVKNNSLIDKITTSKTILSDKLKTIEEEINNFLESYSRSLRENNLIGHLQLFEDNCYSFSNKVLSKEALTKNKTKFFTNFVTTSHKMKLVNFGSADNDMIEVISEEYHFVHPIKEGYDVANGVHKKFILKEEPEGLRIYSENNIDNIFTCNGSFASYRNYQFKISKENETSSILTITYPNGNKFSENEFPTGYLQMDDYANNGDYQILLSVYSGGAHCCFSIQIYDPGVYGLQKSPVLDLKDSEFKFTDLNNNGVREFFTYNASYGYVFTSFAASVFPPVVYEFRNNAFIENTAAYPDVVNKDLSDNIQKMNAIYDQHNNILDCSGDDSSWMGEYRAYLAAIVTDIMLSQGKTKAFEFFDSHYACQSSSNDVWAKISQLTSFYNIKEPQQSEKEPGE
jgi:serine/threonine protein kinase